MIIKIFVYLFCASINLQKKFEINLMIFNYILNYMLSLLVNNYQMD
jgi:hypothetical protein